MIWPEVFQDRITADYIELRKLSGYKIKPNFIHTIYRIVESLSKIRLKTEVTEDIYNEAVNLLKHHNAFFTIL